MKRPEKAKAAAEAVTRSVDRKDLSVTLRHTYRVGVRFGERVPCPVTVGCWLPADHPGKCWLR